MGFLSFRSRRNLANTASLLWHAYKSLPSPSKDVNWAGMFNAMFLLHSDQLGPRYAQNTVFALDPQSGILL